MTEVGSNRQGLLKSFDTFIKKVNNYFTKMSGILILSIAVLIFQDVILRYFFNAPTSWTLDLTSFLLVYVVFLSLSPTLESGKHVSVDLLEEIVSPKVQRILKRIVFLLTIIFGLVFFWKSLHYTIGVAVENKTSTSNIPIPLIYVYLIAPIGLLQFTLTALNLFINTKMDKETV